MTISERDALVIVDPQNDFLPGGALPVAEGRRIFAPIKALLPRFKRVYATRDWHPPGHRFFNAHGGPWPYHCLAGSEGAAFASELDASEIDVVVSKGTDPDTDGYSGFAGTRLAEDLREHGIERIFVCGLATDYCVKSTAIEGVEHGFATIVVTDAIAAVEVKPGDEEAALDEMRRAGVTFVESRDLAVG
jgi:nicotinamidase/pyrazinamidase